jgi:hypothetical protein
MDMLKIVVIIKIKDVNKLEANLSGLTSWELKHEIQISTN